MQGCALSLGCSGAGSPSPGAGLGTALGLGTPAGSFRVAAVPRRSGGILSQRQAVFFDPIHGAAGAAATGAVTSFPIPAHTSKGSGRKLKCC